MQFSTDLPYGSKAIAEYFAHGEPLRMNVSREAEETDPKRWAALDAKLQKDFYRRLREKPAEAA